MTFHCVDLDLDTPNDQELNEVSQSKISVDYNKKINFF